MNGGDTVQISYVYQTEKTTAMLAIETRNLSYAFKFGRKVVDNVSLQVPQGSVYGFLGPNGAGKTTTMRLLTGLLQTGEDNIFLNGKSLVKEAPYIFKDIGTLIETPSLYLHLNARENLKVITTLRNLPASNIDKMLRIVGLEKNASRTVKEYSLGMKQRLAIAMALLPDPKMVMLDEPANGLDPHGIIEMRELLIKLNKEEGKTIFVSSHILAEVEKMCTHVAIIHKGSLRFQGDMESLKKSAEHSRALFVIDNPQQWKPVIESQLPNLGWNNRNELVAAIQNRQDVSELNARLVNLGVPVTSINAGGGLEEWFINMTKN